MQAVPCPQCLESQDPQANFCTQCGLVLRQPCPNCQDELVTPANAFTECSGCHRHFWSCSACGRLYHLDQTTCLNSYCPEFGKFWTTRFGADQFFPGQHVAHPKSAHPDARPAWVSAATPGGDLRWPNLHRFGLVLSVQDSGVLELWAERGAPLAIEGNDFRETSVCLTRLDLGEPAPCAPFHWKDQFFIAGSSTITPLDYSSSPSLGQRIDISLLGQPKLITTLANELLIWGTLGFGRIDESGDVHLIEDWKVSPKAMLISDNQGQALLCQPNPAITRIYRCQEGLGPPLHLGLPEAPDFGLFSDRFTLFQGKRMAILSDSDFEVVELPALVIAQPIFCSTEERLTLLLADGSARTCSPTGTALSFLCELGGVPTTDPLKIGERVYYGTEGRYLCRDEEALRPRLSSIPVGCLSSANGRIFGNLTDGSMFCFEL